MRDMNLRDMKMRHHVAEVENARHEFAAPTCKGGNCETWKCDKRDSMEHRVLHMSIHCRAGMHEETRKSTRFRLRYTRAIFARCKSQFLQPLPMPLTLTTTTTTTKMSTAAISFSQSVLSVHLRRRICAKSVSSTNVMPHLRLCRVGISDSVRRASPT